MEANIGESKAKVDELFVPESSRKVEVSEKDFVDVLRMFAPGTSIRAALDDLLRAGMGALIVVDNGSLSGVFQKGFNVFSRFTPQRLVELAKMDGAIILSKNIKKILYSNSFLSPDSEIPTRETGTRHKAAERTSKQTGAIVIAISERKNKISIYCGEKKHELGSSSELLRRATENLQILEKQRESLSDSLTNLNLLEFQKMGSTSDVCRAIQDFELIKKITGIVKRYLVELGKEGILVSMRLRDLTKGLEKEEDLLIRDYFSDLTFVKKVLEKMDFDFLLEITNISRMLFEDLHDSKVSPKGLRILSKTNILQREVDALTSNFNGLGDILLASDSDLMKVFDNEGMIAFFKEEIYNLREKVVLSKEV